VSVYLKARYPNDKPPPQRSENRGHYKDAEDLLGKSDDGIERSKERKRKPDRNSFTDRFEDGKNEHAKTPKDRYVKNSRNRIAQHLRLTQGDTQHSFESFRDSVEAILAFADREEGKELSHTEAERTERQEQNYREDDIRNRIRAVHNRSVRV
jgi:hypothetical protein